LLPERQHGLLLHRSNRLRRAQEDGPVYSPNGKEIAFVMDDLLYTMRVDANGEPNGKAVQLNHETTDAPTWSGDSNRLLYLSQWKTALIDRATSVITPVHCIGHGSRTSQQVRC